MVQDYIEIGFLQDRYPSSAMERQVELQAKAVGQLFETKELTDRDIEKAIKGLYQVSEAASLDEGLKMPNPGELPSHAGLPSLKEEDRLLPSDVKAPTLELKSLPANLKYTYLGGDETLPVHEGELVNLLKRNEKVIGWILADITGISPDVCMHYIHLEEGAKPHGVPHRKLNLNMIEVVLKEVLKLLANG